MRATKLEPIGMNDPLAISKPTSAAPAPGGALPPGARVERFEIVRVIADTSASVVYLASDHDRRREVVLKEYMPRRLGLRDGTAVRPRTPADAAALADGLRLFIFEARLLTQLDHPSLVRVIDLIEANATAYQVMPYLGGVRLLQVRRETSEPPNERTLRRLLDGLLGALQALHRHEMLHGAVGPANILLLADSQALLLGPARVGSANTGDLVDSLMATVEPSFAAPEQLDRATTLKLGAWTDLYSLAETIRFIISGELPPPAAQSLWHERRESVARMVQRLFGDLPAANYSASLLDTLDAALAADPAARPQSVDAFRAALGPAPASPPLRGGGWPGGAPPADAGARIEPAFTSGFASGESKPAPQRLTAASARSAAAPVLRDAVPSAVPKPPPARRRAHWAGSAIALLLAAGLFGWWRLDPPAPSPARATTDAAPAGTSAAAVQAPIPVVEPPPPVAAPASTGVPAAPTPSARPARIDATAGSVRSRPAPAPISPASPRDACAGRTQFSLYLCMQTQCAQRGWEHHPQCERLRSTDSVD